MGPRELKSIMIQVLAMTIVKNTMRFQTIIHRLYNRILTKCCQDHIYTRSCHSLL